MKYLVTHILSLCLAGTAMGQVKFEKFISTDGISYTDVVVKEVFPDGIKIIHSGGIEKIPMEKLPQVVLNKLGSFDAIEAERYRAELLAKRREARQKAIEDSRAALYDARTWEPYTSIIAEQQRQVTDQQLLDESKSKLVIIKANCEPLLKSKSVTRSTVMSWVQAAADKKILVGMPMDIVRIAWGDPRSASSNSKGGSSWHYNGAYVSFDNGFVDYYRVDH